MSGRKMNLGGGGGRSLLVLLFLALHESTHCRKKRNRQGHDDSLRSLHLDLETAEHLATLPMSCYQQEWPHKYNMVFEKIAQLKFPRTQHPIFYGCFDWHSAAHGHWLLAHVLNKFPESNTAQRIVEIFDEQFTAEKVQGELPLFRDQGENKDFERTYGWSWLMKLQQELEALEGEDDDGKDMSRWAKQLRPLTDAIVAKYKSFLPTLVYPIRVGEHTNTAFGLIYPLEYVVANKTETEFRSTVREKAMSLYADDRRCPLDWEPSGFDFLSPCLQEADLMRLVLKSTHLYGMWVKKFLPQMFSRKGFELKPGEVLDSTDGKLVHLEGVNFSRAWNLYNILMALPHRMAKYRSRLFRLADDHVLASSSEVVGSHYAGSHWLASFYMYALSRREEAVKKFPELERE